MSLLPPSLLAHSAVLLVGGASNMPGLARRLHWEISALVSAAFKPRVISPLPVEKEFAAWIGGSILGKHFAFTLAVERFSYLAN